MVFFFFFSIYSIYSSFSREAIFSIEDFFPI